MESSAVTGAIPAGRAGPDGAAREEQTKNAAVLSSDFETFLKMLTAQMKNQDPLNPVDSTDYATQLATFSSVEQQVLTNDLLADLAQAMTGGTLQQLGSWIGRDVLAEDAVRFDGTPLVLRPDIAPGADAARLVVRDAAGAVVQRLSLDPTEPLVAWRGLDDGGAPIASGIYSFEVESLSGGTIVAQQPAKVYNPVIEVRREGDATLLTLSGGSEIDASSVTALR
ncbi:flagellar hook capping FlgD N-terminal domain-containing protein [Salipiger sp.]|uniref:flagellar hook capping FlgD N-terminal domain-containing protein n=1 Tax=Salipiger sp. TaxID=2078585 RepID=UPI003A96CC84